MLMKNAWFALLLSFPLLSHAQNLVPNPGFEDTTACVFPIADLDCLNDWSLYSGQLNPVLNTSDLCYNGAVFFPPSSIPAYNGTHYIGIDCQPINSEYVQARLTQPLTAGSEYCVSFYASVCNQTIIPAPSLGAYFSVNPVTVNPYTAGLSAQVQSTITFDPLQWQQVTGTYTATGGEQYITLGGFQNGSMTTNTYMYIDQVEVTDCTPPPPPPTNNPTIGNTGIYVPNAFTPNGDGVNDYFPALGEGISNFHLLIFDRWGQLLFSSEDAAHQWDGTFRNRLVEQDVYVYKLSCMAGTEPVYRIGHVTLVH